jgi:tetratricopeptide (TPR) repeat protein
MPKRRAEDVIHVVMTDHLIARRKPSGDLTTPRAERVEVEGVNTYRGEVALYYPEKLSNDADRELYGALAQVAQKSNLKTGISRLEAAIGRHRTAGEPFEAHLATAWLADGQREKARAIFARLAEKNPRDAGALRGLADTEASAEKSLEALRRLLALAPGDPGALYQVAQQTRQISDAAKAVEAAPESPDALNLLASLNKEAGQVAEAERLYREAIRHQPDLAPVHENLAGLLGAAGRFDEALFHFDKSVRLDPRSAGARFGKAAALAALGRYDEAQADARAAAVLNPSNAAAWELLGNLAARRRGWPEAAGHFRRALSALPGFARAELGLGTVLAAQRDLLGARQHLERAAASADPAVRQEALELLREIAGQGGR